MAAIPSMTPFIVDPVSAAISFNQTKYSGSSVKLVGWPKILMECGFSTELLPAVDHAGTAGCAALLGGYLTQPKPKLIFKPDRSAPVEDMYDPVLS
jgi:hypothetical protein